MCLSVHPAFLNQSDFFFHNVMVMEAISSSFRPLLYLKQDGASSLEVGQHREGYIAVPDK
jgi:hypothetical protein